MENFGVKDLYRVVMRATNNMRIGNRNIVAGEPLLYLDGAQIFTQSQNKSYRSARGGKGNFSQVVWESGGDVNFFIQDGVVSPIGYALLTNLQVLDTPTNGTTILKKTEIVAADYRGRVLPKHSPVDSEPLFVYGFENNVIQERLDWVMVGAEVDLGIANANRPLLVDYSYEYGDKVREYRLGKERFNGCLSLEARYYARSESGVEKTNIILLPKVKIISDISLRIGENVAGPTLSTFSIVALADMNSGEPVVMRTLQLEEDVDGM